MKRKIIIVISVILVLATTLSILCYATNQTTGPASYNLPKAEDFPDDGPTSLLITEDKCPKKRYVLGNRTIFYRIFRGRNRT